MVENSFSASSGSKARIFWARIEDFSWLVRPRPPLVVDPDMTDLSSSAELGSGLRTMFRISRSTSSRYAWMVVEIYLDRWRPEILDKRAVRSSPVTLIYAGKVESSCA